LIVAALIVRTWVRNADWHDDLSLMTSAVSTSPDSYKTHSLLAGALYESDPSHANIDRVIAEAEKGLAILNPVADWHNNPRSYQRAAEYYLAKGDLLATGRAAVEEVDRAAAGAAAGKVGATGRAAAAGAVEAVGQPDSRKAYQRSLERLLRVRSIVRATAGLPDEATVAVVERTISTVELRLSDSQGAVEAARNAARLDPANAASYLNLSSALLAAGHADEAAATLVEGSLVTADVTLRQELVRLYQSGLDTEGCATVASPRGPLINPKCEIVRRHVCAASDAAIELYERLGRQDLVEKTKATAGREFGCWVRK
jgi:tetratricopeptide (TPR) repeat protein